jgi:EmrB/QacA subfamily drug resistance transporter
MTKKQRFTLIATIIGSGAVILDGTGVNLALPHIGREFKVDFSALQWIVDGYLLTLSALILLGGSLGDIFGQRRIYFIGLIGFGAASLLCGLAPNAGLLIIWRLVQGMFGALLVPGALAIINTNFTPDKRAAAIGTWSGFLPVITAIGPLLGGYLVVIGSWRWIFFINVPLVLTTLVFGIIGIKNETRKVERRVDYLGGILAMIGLGGITYGLIEGPVAHWTAGSITILCMGILALYIFKLYEGLTPDPMLKLSLFRSHNFVAANITTFAMYGALGGFLFSLVIYLKMVAHYSPLAAGASLIPLTVIMFIVSPLAGEAAFKYGPRAFMTLGPILAAIGIGYLGFLRNSAPYITDVLPGVLLFSLGLSLTVAPLTNTIMSSVMIGESGIASGVNNAVAGVAGLIVIAFLGIFGANESFQFAAVLCACLSLAAGLVSWILVSDKVKNTDLTVS